MSRDIADMFFDALYFIGFIYFSWQQEPYAMAMIAVFWIVFILNGIWRDL